MSKADPKVLEWLKSLPEPDLTDPDNPELTEEDFARMRPAREVLGDAFVDAWEAKRRGRPKLAHPKDVVKLRLDHAVVEHFKAGGPGWQTRINEALVKAVEKARS